MKKEDVKAIFLKTIQKFGQTPQQINRGDCDRFAWRIHELIPNSKVYETPLEHDVIIGEKGEEIVVPTHFFVKIDNRYYDAETIEGVKDYCELPPFKRSGIPSKCTLHLVEWT